MFIQKFFASISFIRVLFFRILLGIIVAHYWVISVIVIFHFTGENIVSQHADIGFPNGIYDYFDSKYDTGNPIFSIVGWIASIGYIGCMVFGLFWGFCQGKLDWSNWLIRRYVDKKCFLYKEYYGTN